jgi:hypothetical protein
MSNVVPRQPMDGSERTAFLQGIADGSIALADVGGLGTDDVDAIARVGAAALAGGRFALAEQVFAALAALDPRTPVHRLHLALARQGRGDVDGAIAAVSDQLTLCAAGDDEDVARGLLLRAELLGRTDRTAALADLGAARALSSAAARAVVDAALGSRPAPAGGRQ